MKVNTNLNLSTLSMLPRPRTFRYSYPPIIVKNRYFTTDPDIEPSQIFKPMMNGSSPNSPRWIFEDSIGPAILILTDGSAPGNGTAAARAGCGFVFRPDGKGSISRPLARVPGYELTSNRAELRAAHLALGFRAWAGEGFRKIVIGTDSDYLVKGICEYIYKWKKSGWKTSTGQPLKNADLWKMLLSEVERLENDGIHVVFYLLKRAWNTEADACAKAGAEMVDVPTEFLPEYGVTI
ncbi:hypothetical protein BOTBODRAFT_163792 [Botryobasidium botryosum FD-172 SS1]|uniref:ribonuclease H n=1 Tax=Botryobasidium botryosum (strain FD-172 SS1) TaxID=930990 RepID=A0A067MF42_BOTB1|nr:hypothetical protein BOTBODRAFT_163792 [Botryobasidium botryosum FD-172 SS1]